MEPFNPYAPPVASAAVTGVGAGSWRLDGDTLVVDKGATLPNLCLFDGRPVEGAPLQKTLTWVPPWVTILVLLSPLIYLIAFFIVRKTGSLGYWLGEEAKRRRNGGIVLLVLSVVSLFLFFFAAGLLEEPLLILVGFVAFFALLITGALRIRLFTVKRIDEHCLWVQLRPEAARAFAARAG